jgi:hypothetical protein
MRFGLAAVLLTLTALIIGCGGSTSDSTTSTTTTSGSTSTTTTGGGSTISLTGDAGSYSGTFSGTRSGATFAPLSYSGTGTATLQADGSANLSFTATAPSNGLEISQSFIGTFSSSGAFTGYTPIAPTSGPVQDITTTGTLTQVSSTQIQVVLTWSQLFSNGGTYFTATETFNLTLQSSSSSVRKFHTRN